MKIILLLIASLYLSVGLASNDEISLEQHLEAKIKAEHDLTEAHFKALAQAVEKAEKNNDERLHAMNEFRALIENLIGNFATRNDLTSLEEKMVIRHEDTLKRVSNIETSDSIMTGKTAMIWMFFVVGMTIASAGISLYAVLAQHKVHKQ